MGRKWLFKRKNCFIAYVCKCLQKNLPETFSSFYPGRELQKGTGRQRRLLFLFGTLHTVWLDFLVYLLFLMRSFRKDQFNENKRTHGDFICHFLWSRKKSFVYQLFGLGKLVNLSVACYLIWKIGLITVPASRSGCEDSMRGMSSAKSWLSQALSHPSYCWHHSNAALRQNLAI